jgi:predicted transcriptional regulator
MIHVYWLEQGIDDKHMGPFKTEMRRINALGFNVAQYRDLDAGLASGDIALKASGKKYAVFVRKTPRGATHIVVSLAKAMEYTMWLAANFLVMSPLRNPISGLEFDVYVHSSGWLDDAKITKRGKGHRLTMYGLSSGELEELETKGKKITTIRAMTMAEFEEWSKSVKF